MRELRLPTLELPQGTRRLYQFAIDGKVLPEVCAVSRVRRDSEHEIAGYQRPEALAHIRAIRTYLEGDDPLMPNALVIAFDGRVRFEAAAKSRVRGARVGELVVPLDADNQPGFIVDGQQRSAALRDADIQGFLVPVVAFITDEVAEQRAQFILVNSTKPLPKGLIHELLPATEGVLPAALARKRSPALLLERLNYTEPCKRWPEGSPLCGLIRTPTTPEGVIKDNSVLKMLENSLSDGALYRYRDPATGEVVDDAALDCLFRFWGAVRAVFPEAWAQPPRRSRLMHGVGIVAMGFVMDAICDRRGGETLPTEDVFERDIRPLRDVCAWTDGWWEFGLRDRRRWNELQNTPKDIGLLTDYLLAEYRARTSESLAEAGSERRRALRVVAG